MSAGPLTITVQGSGSFQCPADVNLLRAMEQSGLRLIPVGCRGGGCGICKVRVLSGRYRTGPMSRSRVTPTERVTGFALSCRTFPVSEMSIALASSRRSG